MFVDKNEISLYRKYNLRIFKKHSFLPPAENWLFSFLSSPKVYCCNSLKSVFFYERNKNSTIGEIRKSKTIFHFSSYIERRSFRKLDKLITLTPDFDKVFPPFSKNKENLNRKRWMFPKREEVDGEPSSARRQWRFFEIRGEIFMKTTDKKLMSEGYKMFWWCLFFPFFISYCLTFYFHFFQLIVHRIIEGLSF